MNYRKNRLNFKKIHFVGIGGVSMSALAHFALNKGCIVSGSDLALNDYTDNLAKKGAKIYAGHEAKNAENVDLLVYNSAVKSNNPELLYGKKNTKVIERNRFLKIISDNYKKVIAVSGSHGKTSTSALISEIFYKCGKHPGMHIGGDSNFFNSNYQIGKPSFFITEACEYKRNFLTLTPDIAIILNIDEDHPDYYKDLNDIKDAFYSFSKNTNKNGSIIINADDNNSDIFLKYAVKIGIDNKAHYHAKNIKYENDKYSFDVFKKNKYIGRIKLSVYGYHNIYNALFGFAAADICNLKTEKVIEAISDFKGVYRRFENIGMINCAKVISDYAHHPREIAGTISNALTIDKNVTCVFQSHTYSRTKKFLLDFAKCFKDCNLILTDIYAAREEYDENVLNDLIIECKNYTNKVNYVKDYEVFDYLQKNIKDGIILILGAGDLHFTVLNALKNNR